MYILFLTTFNLGPCQLAEPMVWNFKNAGIHSTYIMHQIKSQLLLSWCCDNLPKHYFINFILNYLSNILFYVFHIL
jgi:hypothetical protein